MVITTGKLSKEMHLVSLLTLELNHITFGLQDPQEPARLHHLGTELSLMPYSTQQSWEK